MESLSILNINKLLRFNNSRSYKDAVFYREAKELTQETLNIVFDSLSGIFAASQFPTANFWKALSELSSIIVNLDLTGKDMPWQGLSLNESQKDSVMYLNRCVGFAYFDNALKYNKQDEHEYARKQYSKILGFAPEPVLAVQLHFNWAVSIDKINNLFQNLSPDRSLETIAKYCEMVSHFDEAIQQYALIEDEDMKKCLERMRDQAAESVQNALSLKSRFIRYSNAKGQLVMNNPNNSTEEVPINITWAEYDLYQQ
jgi:tetratricopeptide (TPR) repeat protein